MVDGPAPDRERALELAQAGANEAALAIARMLKMTAARVSPLETVADGKLAERHGPRALVVSFTISGGVAGRFAVVTSEAHARALAKELVPSLKGDGLPKKAVGALTELGNIGASAYLNGIADMLNVTCVPSVPHFVVDETHAALASALGGAPLIVARVTAGPHEVDLALAI
jgi:chemotaxis protein CheY-P-specific phosphatase CheC